MGELSLDYSQIASLMEHCAQNSRFQKLTTNMTITLTMKKKWKGRGRKNDQFIRDTLIN